MRPRKSWTRTTRREVLLRCFFKCTSPGCQNLAEDLHHVVLHSQGGSNSAGNVLGLCRDCHKWVHREKEREKLARRWLTDQIDNCRARVDPVTRSVLFEEVLNATQSNVAMRHHTTSVYRSDSWNNYEVFLKAAWEFLVLNGRSSGKTATVLLYHFVNLYRRRSGELYNRAAGRYIQQLNKNYSELPSKIGLEWLKPKILYQEGYLFFLANAASPVALQLFNRSAEFETKGGNTVGRAISAAQATVVRLRQGEDVDGDIQRCQDTIADAADTDAIRWYTQNIPIHRSCVALMKQDYTLAAELAEPIALLDSATQSYRPSKALYVLGLAAFQMNATPANAIALLEKSRKSYWAAAATEGRASVMVSLGDAYWSIGERQKAEEMYREALRQPAYMDNQRAIAIGKRRLVKLLDRGVWKDQLYHPWNQERA